MPEPKPPAPPRIIRSKLVGGPPRARRPPPRPPRVARFRRASRVALSSTFATSWAAIASLSSCDRRMARGMNLPPARAPRAAGAAVAARVAAGPGPAFELDEASAPVFSEGSAGYASVMFVSGAVAGLAALEAEAAPLAPPRPPRPRGAPAPRPRAGLARPGRGPVMASVRRQ